MDLKMVSFRLLVNLTWNIKKQTDFTRQRLLIKEDIIEIRFQKELF
jgi:hypothetical protein